MTAFRFLRPTLAGLMVLALVLFIAPPDVIKAQTPGTLTQTTLSTALTGGQSPSEDRIVVASATGFAAGRVVYMDTEAMQVQQSYVSGTTIPVTRGVRGTSRQAHAASSLVYVSLASNFYATDVAGPCTAANEVLPHVNLNTGNVFDCKNGQWVRLRTGGQNVDGSHSFYTYTAAGAISLAPGMHFVNGTTLAMTLASPTRSMDGMVMSICAANASAHTLTYTGGFGGGGTGEDVGTYSGAAGDCLTIRAANSLWWIVGAHQVTLA